MGKSVYSLKLMLDTYSQNNNLKNNLKDTSNDPYYQYIKTNYNPCEYGYSSWDYNKDINWMDIFEKLSSPKIKINIKKCVGLKFKSMDFLSIHKKDTISDVINRIFRLYDMNATNQQSKNYGKIWIVMFSINNMNLYYKKNQIILETIDPLLYNKYIFGSEITNKQILSPDTIMETFIDSINSSIFDKITGASVSLL